MTSSQPLAGGYKLLLGDVHLRSSFLEYFITPEEMNAVESVDELKTIIRRKLDEQF